MKDYFYNSVFYGLLVMNSIYLASSDWDYLLLPFIVIQSLMLLGLVEAFHQCVHGNLFPQRAMNIVFGIINGLVLGANFYSYRQLHGKHHMYSNTRNDPEQEFYRGASGRLITLLIIPFIVTRNVQVSNNSKHLVPDSQKRVYALNNIAVFLVTILGIVALVLYTDLALRVFLVPLMIFYYIEFFIAQSQHYNTDYIDQDRITPEKQLEVSVDIKLPYYIGFLMLFTNYHATHHYAQRTKWYDSPVVAKGISNRREIGFMSFLKIWWRDGRRTWSDEWRYDVSEG